MQISIVIRAIYIYIIINIFIVTAISCAYYVASVRAFGLCLFAHFCCQPFSWQSRAHSLLILTSMRVVGRAEFCELLVVRD